MRQRIGVLLVVGGMLAGCPGEQGPAGNDGEPGDDGVPCFAGLTDQNGDGVVDVLDCRGDDGVDGTSGTNGVNGTNGANGAAGGDGIHCWDLDGDGQAEVASEDQNGDGVVDAADCAGVDGQNGANGLNGLDGHDAAGYVALEPAGVVGVVSDTAGALVSGGTVYLVPAAAVAALAATTVAVTSTSDEPLEDLIAASGTLYHSAGVGSDGRYALTTLTAGSYFVTFVPAVGDSAHLPGGSACRSAMDSSALVGTRLDLRVSSAAPADARYVGSGACVSCHGRAHIGETMHRLGIWSAYESGRLQDFGPRFDEIYQAIEDKFEAVGGTTVYFYDHDSTRGFDKYKTLESDPAPAGVVSFTATVRRDSASGDLELLLHNVKNAGDPDRVYRVDLIYGGGVNKQRYMTRLSNPSGEFHALLPLQFQNEGADSAPYGRTSKVWRDYNGYKWYDENTTTFKEPVNKDSFEKNCVSCHAVGARVTGTDATLWSAQYVEDRFYASGDVDLDGDGVAEELNVGCESCHGPGSRHWEAAGQGEHIVSPSLLTPEREAMLCGQCHSRPKGALGTDSPVNAAGWMMRAGTSRHDFLQGYATTQLDGAASDYYADPDQHSKSHHQQYSDFIRSGMYKNGSTLMTCSACHDVHQRTANTRQLIASPTDNTALCGSCHAAQSSDLAAHLTAKYSAAVATKASLATCVDCHMTKAAKTGAGQPGLLLQGVQYWTNDVTSHLFKVPDRALATSQQMPVPYTSACGSCHSAAP